MKTLHNVIPEAPKVFLAGIWLQSSPKKDSEMVELRNLANTLSLNIVGMEIFKIPEQFSRYGMGSGKARELSEKSLALGAECIIFDRELSPSQQRNWEELSGLAVIDRQELIIRIFASRAKTREAELQAELAELLYALPRLTHKYIDLARQRGGRYGTRGEGETRLETDRRQIRQRIDNLRKEIELVRRSRKLQRKQRDKRKIPSLALVGYTNAGKSCLHQALTGSDAFVENKLFATLDPTVRRVSRLGVSGIRKNIIIVDTVGFIRHLPHNLVDAFRSTLEEAAQADLLIHVLDISDPEAESYNAVVLKTLGELGAGEIPRITALNKIDLVSDADLKAMKTGFLGDNSPTVTISAKNRIGFEALWKLIEKTFKF